MSSTEKNYKFCRSNFAFCEVQDRANAAVLGIDSAESRHSNDDGTSDDDDDDSAVAAARVGVVDGEVAAAGVDVVGGPPVDIRFSPIHTENEDGDEDVDGEVAAANNAGEMIAAVARGEDAARARPQSMPLLNRAGSAVSSAASHGGSGSKSTAPRRSPSSFVVESRGGGEGRQRIQRIAIACHSQSPFREWPNRSKP